MNIICVLDMLSDSASFVSLFWTIRNLTYGSNCALRSFTLSEIQDNIEAEVQLLEEEYKKDLLYHDKFMNQESEKHDNGNSTSLQTLVGDAVYLPHWLGKAISSENRKKRINTPFGAKNTFVYPHETGNTMLFPLLILLLFTLFIGSIGIHFDNGVKDNRILELTILSKKILILP
ncbi:hypothetical protein ACJX0J_028547 [Zea mays]